MMELEGFANFKDAACRMTDPELFFPKKGRSSLLARRICQSCPEKIACRDFAIEHIEIQHGVWGGLNINDIIKLRDKVSDEAA